MRTAIYVEDGVLQLVLTPETDFEKTSLTSLYEKRIRAEIFEGSFYDCRGGWTRQQQHHQVYDRYGSPVEPTSLIVRVDDSPPAAPLAENNWAQPGDLDHPDSPCDTGAKS